MDKKLENHKRAKRQNVLWARIIWVRGVGKVDADTVRNFCPEFRASLARVNVRCWFSLKG